MYSLSKLPAAKLKALLDDRQWKLLQQHLNQGRAMEATLAQMSIIDSPKGKAVAARGGGGGFLGQLFGVGAPVAVEAFAVDEMEAVAGEVIFEAAVGNVIAVEAVPNVAVAIAVDQAVVEHGDADQNNAPADALKPVNGRRKVKR